MSNSYLKFAVTFPFPEKAAKEIVSLCEFFENPSNEAFAEQEWFFSKVDWDDNVLEAIRNDPENIQDILYDEGIYPPNLMADWFPKNGLYLASDQGNLEFTCEMLRISMERNEIKDTVSFETAIFSDQLRVGEFGGISCAVNRNGYVMENTESLCSELEARLEFIDMRHLDLATRECCEMFKPFINDIFDESVRQNCDKEQAREDFCDDLRSRITEIVDDDLKEKGIESIFLGFAGKLDEINYNQIFEKKMENRPNCFAGPTL